MELQVALQGWNNARMWDGSVSAGLIAWTGVAAGCHHALTGPDHLAGVAPFAATQGRRAWRIGVAWGLGHATGAALGAIVALSLRSVLPGVEERLSSISETLVGVVLCVVGAFGIHAWVRSRSHAHPHSHDGVPHEHGHLHLLGRPHRDNAGEGASIPHRHGHSAYALGVVHGAAGLSHLFAVLPALALPGIALPCIYLAGYGTGSLASVTTFAGILGCIAPSSRQGRVRMLLVCSSAASLLVGLAWIVHPF